MIKPAGGGGGYFFGREAAECIACSNTGLISVGWITLYSALPSHNINIVYTDLLVYISETELMLLLTTLGILPKHYLKKPVAS